MEHGLAIEPPEAFGAEDFRRTLGHFASGVTIVTAASGAERFGMTCQSFFSLSLDPPLVAFSPAKSSRSYPAIREAGSFCINVLSAAQQDLSLGFARSGADKWADVAWRPGVTGSPILEGVLAWIDCTLEAEHDTGDHWLVIGRVRALEGSDHKPLLFFKGGFQQLA
ncbi:flavin reductase family protein [Sphingomonas sp. CGMCC 1.13654]|uniref:Flavin reductase family protein n=1 Tax=Sphingomonas chungangi TaxID=2683589 RepID=A0A838L7X7_9SPHN|nr:flavin reductase family protein [Sphingomonas chungangi]MBA2934795.1 flavin reductase family protein [Sphingomonas chungangi]MVW58106.1 flavin reductase [Sphingomonas chungangi]